MSKPEVVECEYSSQYRRIESSFIWNSPGKYIDGINKFLSYMRTDRNEPIIEKGGFKIAKRFGFSRNDFSLKDVRSFYSYEKLWDQFGNFFSDQKTNYDARLIHKCAQLAVNDLGILDDSLDLLDLNADMYKRIDPSKSAGLPTMSNKGDAFADSLARSISILNHGKYFTPAVATSRTQKNFKTRLAWAFSLDQILIEHMIYGPIFDNLRFDHPLMSKSASSITAQKIYSAEIKYRYNIGVDYSQFDSRVPAGIIRIVFSKIKKLFKRSGKSQTYLNKLDKVFDLIIDGFINTNILMPNGKIYQKHRGIPSGSQLTSLIGSLCNLTMLKSYFVENNIYAKCYVLGDDSASFTDVKISLNHLSQYMSHKFGMIVNPDKCSVRKSGQGVEVLGYTYSKGFRFEPVRDTLAKLIFPESTRKTVNSYSYFLSNLVLSYAKTNQNIRDNLHKAIRKPFCSPSNMRPFGDPTDYVYNAKGNRGPDHIRNDKLAQYEKELGESVVIHSFS